MTKVNSEEIKAEEIQEIERFIKRILYAFEVPRRRNYINDDTGNYVSKGESRDRVLYILSTIAVVLVVLSINLTGIFFIKFTSGNSHDDLSISTGEESSSVDLESESQKMRSNTLTLLVITTSREEMLMNIVIKKDLSFHVNSTRIFKEGNPNVSPAYNLSTGMQWYGFYPYFGTNLQKSILNFNQKTVLLEWQDKKNLKLFEHISNERVLPKTSIDQFIINYQKKLENIDGVSKDKLEELDELKVTKWDEHSRGVQVGYYFWIYAGRKSPKLMAELYGLNQMVLSKITLLWNFIKMTWQIGPRLPKNIYLFDTPATAINSSHIIFVGINTEHHSDSDQSYTSYPIMGKYATVMFDFSSNKWQHLANLPNIELAHNTQSCHLICPISLTVFIAKSGKKYLFASISPVSVWSKIQMHVMDLTDFSNEWTIYYTNIGVDYSGILTSYNGYLMYLSYPLLTYFSGFVMDPSNFTTWNPIGNSKTDEYYYMTDRFCPYEFWLQKVIPTTQYL